MFVLIDLMYFVCVKLYHICIRLCFSSQINKLQKIMHIKLIQNKMYMHNIMIVIIERYM